MIEVRSHFDEETGTFTRPENILIRNCNIIGSIRVWGMRKNGEGNGLEKDGKEINLYKDSSEAAGHTERARNNTPMNITFDNMVIIGVARNPFYLAPGVTNSGLINSELKGSSESR